MEISDVIPALCLGVAGSYPPQAQRANGTEMSAAATRSHCVCSHFTLDISKAFDRVWHKALLSKLPSYGFYPDLCSFLSSYLSGRSIAAVVDGHCSTRKPINSGVPQGSVLSLNLYYSSMIFS